MAIARDQARELAIHFAGALQGRRLYAVGSSTWMKTLEALAEDFKAWFTGRPDTELLTIALLADGIAISGIPILQAPPTLGKLAQALKARDVEVISIGRETALSEVETVLAFLSADAADVAGVQPSAWLRERGVEHIEVKQLRLVEAAEGLDSFRDVFRMGGQVMGQEFQRASREGTIDMRPVAELAKVMLGTLGSNMPVATLLALRERDDYTHIHSVNVGMLAGCQALAFGLPETEVEAVTSAGLMHDIGKARVPDTVLQKRSPLTLQEQALLNSHSVEGARLLVQSQGGESLSALVALEHHRPSGVSHPAISFAAQLVALADTLDTLRTLRPFEHRHGLRGALTFMMQHLTARFSPYLLSRFATLCGYFMPGDMVHLRSGEVAKIVEAHPESVRHPTVEIVDTAVGKLAPGTRHDLARQTSADKLSLALPTLDAFQSLSPKELDWMG